MTLRPFWNYYGAKWRAAKTYPSPNHPTIIEPFAGAAGYSLRHPDRDVILYDIDHKICAIWEWLIRAEKPDVLRIPLVDSVDDLPHGTPDGARWLVGFLLNAGAAQPCKTRSKWAQRGGGAYWGESRRQRIAEQVSAIKHWRVVHGTYADAPDIPATWFVDPPYDNRAGDRYKHGRGGIDYADLARWCRSRSGQTIVCENEGARWLPFRHHGTHKANQGRRSREVIWTQDM